MYQVTGDILDRFLEEVKRSTDRIKEGTASEEGECRKDGGRSRHYSEIQLYLNEMMNAGNWRSLSYRHRTWGGVSDVEDIWDRPTEKQPHRWAYKQ